MQPYGRRSVVDSDTRGSPYFVYLVGKGPSVSYSVQAAPATDQRLAGAMILSEDHQICSAVREQRSQATSRLRRSWMGGRGGAQVTSTPCPSLKLKRSRFSSWLV